MNQFLNKIVKYTLTFVFTAYILGIVLSSQFSKNNNEKANWILNKNNQYFDYAIIGSSRVMNMFNTTVIDSSLDTKGINLGYGGAGFKFNYLSLYIFLENNSLQELFLQVDPFELYNSRTYKQPKLDHFFFGYLNDENIFQSLNDYHGQSKLLVYKYMPIFGMIEYNPVYNLPNFLRSFSSHSRYDSLNGAWLINELDEFIPPAKNIFLKSNNQTLTKDLKYLKKIIELCKEKNIKLNFFTAPIYSYDYYFLDKYPKFEKDINEIVYDYDLKYYDFKDFLINKNSFNDPIHLNYHGTQHFSELFISIIEKEFSRIQN